MRRVDSSQGTQIPCGTLFLGDIMTGVWVGFLCFALGPVEPTEAKLPTNFLTGAQGFALFPKGIVRLKETLLVDLAQLGRIQLVGQGTQLIMEGPGPAIRVVGSFVAGNAEPKNVPQLVRHREWGCSLSGLDIVGGHPDAGGIELSGTMAMSIRGVSVRSCKLGIHLIKLNRNLLVADCHLYDNSGCGIFYDNVNLHQSNITGCHISYCRGGGIVSRGGDVRNIQIANCDIEANMDTDAKALPTANIELDSTGGSVAEVAITGCTIQHSKANGSANIRIKGKGDGGKLGPTREGHFTITGNVLSDVETNVDLLDCRGVTLTGNTFWMGYVHNLKVQRSSHIVLGPNSMERNPRYDYGTSKEASNSVVFLQCENCTIQGLNLHQTKKAKAGLVVEDSFGFNISGCSIIECEPTGMMLIRVKESLVSGCRIKVDKIKASPFVTIGCDNLIFAGNNFFQQAGPAK